MQVFTTFIFIDDSMAGDPRLHVVFNESFSVPYLNARAAWLCPVLHWSVVSSDLVHSLSSRLMQSVKGPLTGLSCLFVFVQVCC